MSLGFNNSIKNNSLKTKVILNLENNTLNFRISLKRGFCRKIVVNILRIVTVLTNPSLRIFISKICNPYKLSSTTSRTFIRFLLKLLCAFFHNYQPYSPDSYRTPSHPLLLGLQIHSASESSSTLSIFSPQNLHAGASTYQVPTRTGAFLPILE